MAHPVSPLAPKDYPELPEVAGIRFATAEAGIKYRNRTDVLLVAMDPGTVVAGVLTRSKCPSAAIDWCRDRLAEHSAYIREHLEDLPEIAHWSLAART